MRRNASFSKLRTKMKSSLFGTALVALLGFAFQSVALPVHTTVHAAVETLQFTAPAKTAANGFAARTTAPRTIAADCDLCALASHQAVHFEVVPVFATEETVELRPGTPAVEALSSFFRYLPPARAPPVRV